MKPAGTRAREKNATSSTAASNGFRAHLTGIRFLTSNSLTDAPPGLHGQNSVPDERRESAYPLLHRQFVCRADTIISSRARSENPILQFDAIAKSTAKSGGGRGFERAKLFYKSIGY